MTNSSIRSNAVQALLAVFATAAVMLAFPVFEHLSSKGKAIPAHKPPVPVKIEHIEMQTAAGQVTRLVSSRTAKAVNFTPAAPPLPLTAPERTPKTAFAPKPATPLAQTPSDTAPPAVKMTAPSAETDNAAARQESDLGNGSIPDWIPDGNTAAQPPVPLKRVSPVYPERSRRLNQEGFALVHFIIDERGLVSSPQVQQSSPEGHFEKAVLNAIRQWRFSPARDDKGNAIRCSLQLRIDFKLKDR